MRYQHRYRSGQSIVLLALMMVVIVGMVGLSVDVGNAYAQQRRVQNGVNAAALAGMNAALENQNNSEVWKNVQRSLAGNRIDPKGVQYTYTVEYVFKTGSPQILATWNGSATVPAIIAGTPPALNDLARLRVTLTQRTNTYFASVVGRNDLTVAEKADACFGNFGMDVYPVGVPWELKPKKGTGSSSEKWHRVFQRQNIVPTHPNYNKLQEINPNTSGWGDWDNILMKEAFVFLPIRNDSDMDGTHVAWLDWTNGGGGTSELSRAWVPPGTLEGGFTPANGSSPKQLAAGDLISGKTGVSGGNGVDTGLRNMLNNEHMLLPMYDFVPGNGSNAVFPYRTMKRFMLVGYSFGGQSGGRPHPDDDTNEKFLMLQYLGDASGGTATACATAP